MPCISQPFFPVQVFDLLPDGIYHYAMLKIANGTSKRKRIEISIRRDVYAREDGLIRPRVHKDLDVDQTSCLCYASDAHQLKKMNS